jgi:hypothetical protein
VNFKKWLIVSETGTSSAGAAVPASGSTDSSMIAVVPTQLFAGSKVRRKFANKIAGELGLAGPLRTIKFNKS